MNVLRLLLAAVLLSGSSAVLAAYDLTKTLTVVDDAGGTFTQTVNGSIIDDSGSFSASSTFDDFLIVDDERMVTADGELSATFIGSRFSFDYVLNGVVDFSVGSTTYTADFEDIGVSRNGLLFQFSGNLFVNGNEYIIGNGSLAEQILVAIVLLHGQ